MHPSPLALVAIALFGGACSSAAPSSNDPLTLTMAPAGCGGGDAATGTPSPGGGLDAGLSPADAPSAAPDATPHVDAAVPPGGGGDFRSPVFFMPLDNQPQDLAQAALASGEKSYLLAFVLDAGGCTPAWDGQSDALVANDTKVAQAIAALRAAGGDVGISFGGYNGTELGQSCATASALAAAYQSVIDRYALTHIDLDVENTALGDVGNEAKRFAAVKILEDAAKAAGRELHVSLTIPTTTVGLPDTGKEELRQAIAAGARIDVVNAMDFDYGGPAATQADADVQVADAVEKQLVAVFGWSDDEAYAHLGVQLMNGHTDQPSELFTVDTFQKMLAYAKQHHVAWLSYWSLNRDRACDPALPHNWADGACSSVDQQPYDFTKIVAQYHG